MSEPVIRSHTLIVWPNDATQVVVEVFHTEAAGGEFSKAGVKVDILRSPAPSPHVEFALGRLPNDLVAGRADALGAGSVEMMLADVGDDPLNITLGEVSGKPRKIERGGTEAKIVADVHLAHATIRLTVGDWSDVVEVSIENHGDDNGGQYWSVHPKGTGWEFLLH